MTLAELVTYLAATGSGTAGTNIFYGSLRESYPDVVTVVMMYTGFEDEPTLSDNSESGKHVRLEYPNIRFLFRGAADDLDSPMTRALAARDAVVAVVNTYLSGTKYLSIEPRDPYPLKQDHNFRWEVVFDARVTKEPSEDTTTSWIDGNWVQ